MFFQNAQDAGAVFPPTGSLSRHTDGGFHGHTQDHQFRYTVFQNMALPGSVPIFMRHEQNIDVFPNQQYDQYVEKMLSHILGWLAQTCINSLQSVTGGHNVL